jgi:predicted AAA+ superfamily ATPase
MKLNEFPQNQYNPDDDVYIDLEDEYELDNICIEEEKEEEEKDCENINSTRGEVDAIVDLHSNSTSDDKAGYVQWELYDNEYYPARKTRNKLSPGWYAVIYNHGRQQHFFKKKKIVTEEILKLPDQKMENILDDIKNFWQRKKIYNEYGFVYKRGVLLYGPPGCGKTSIIQLLAEELVENHEGIVVNMSTPDDVFQFDIIMSTFREIEPERKIIVIFEDVDNLMKNQDTTTALLNILDGNMRTNNVVHIATTNYPENIQERFFNRPSRFDILHMIGYPNEEVREFYIRAKLKPEDLAKINLKHWVLETENFTLDHIKELILLTFVLGNNFENSIKKIKKMRGKRSMKPTPLNPTEKIGFNQKAAELKTIQGLASNKN